MANTNYRQNWQQEALKTLLRTAMKGAGRLFLVKATSGLTAADVRDLESRNGLGFDQYLIFDSINEAVTAQLADPRLGDVFYLTPGSHTLTATTSALTAVDVVCNGATVTGAYTFTLGDGCTVKGGKWRNGPSSGYAITITGDDNTLEGCQFIFSTERGVKVTNDRNAIKGCYFAQTLAMGVYLDVVTANITYLRVADCSFACLNAIDTTGNSGSGIFSHCVIDKCIFTPGTASVGTDDLIDTATNISGTPVNNLLSNCTFALSTFASANINMSAGWYYIGNLTLAGINSGAPA